MIQWGDIAPLYAPSWDQVPARGRVSALIPALRLPAEVCSVALTRGIIMNPRCAPGVRKERRGVIWHHSWLNVAKRNLP